MYYDKLTDLNKGITNYSLKSSLTVYFTRGASCGYCISPTPASTNDALTAERSRKCGPVAQQRASRHVAPAAQHASQSPGRDNGVPSQLRT